MAHDNSSCFSKLDGFSVGFLSSCVSSSAMVPRVQSSICSWVQKAGSCPDKSHGDKLVELSLKSTFSSFFLLSGSCLLLSPYLHIESKVLWQSDDDNMFVLVCFFWTPIDRVSKVWGSSKLWEKQSISVRSFLSPFCFDVLLVVWLDSWRHFLVCIVIWYKHKVTNKMWNKWKLKRTKDVYMYSSQPIYPKGVQGCRLRCGTHNRIFFHLEHGLMQQKICIISTKEKK